MAAQVAFDPLSVLDDEAEAIESIYGEEATIIKEPQREFIITIPAPKPISVHIRLGAEYPMSGPPADINIEADGLFGFDDRALLRNEMKALWSSGEPCVFAMIEFVREAVERKQTLSINGKEGQANLDLDGCVAAEGLILAAEVAHSMKTGSSFKDHEDAEGKPRPSSNNQRDIDSPASLIDSTDFTFYPPFPKFGQKPKHFTSSSIDPVHALEIVSGEAVVERKSVFQAHLAVGVTSKEQVDWVMRALLSDNKVSRATHNIMAYRFTDPATGCTVADNDEDGEDGAGAKVAQLLVAMKCGGGGEASGGSRNSNGRNETSRSSSRGGGSSCSGTSGVSVLSGGVPTSASASRGVVVVVSRWYGGVKLGPDRFRLINNAARELLSSRGFGAQRSANEQQQQKASPQPRESSHRKKKGR